MSKQIFEQDNNNKIEYSVSDLVIFNDQQIYPNINSRKTVCIKIRLCTV